MKKDVKEKWLTALRSGEYTQTKGRLHRTEASRLSSAGYCCLGVLCEVAVAEGVIDSYVADAAYLPAAVRTWAGLRFEPMQTLARMNDNRGRSFEQIADYIEARHKAVD